MPGIGGLSIANNLLANSASLNLNRNQAALSTAVTRLSSGLRINTAADDPSGLAIAESLQAQVNGFDQAARNVQDATNAAQVAEKSESAGLLAGRYRVGGRHRTGGPWTWRRGTGLPSSATFVR